MPSILHSKSVALNDTMIPKKKTFNNLRKTYKGYDVAKDEGTTATAEDLAEALVTKLTAINTSVLELNASLGLGLDTRSSLSTVTDRFIPSTSSVIRQFQDLESFTNRKLKNNLNMFSVSQVAEITGKFVEFKNQVEMFDNELDGRRVADHLRSKKEKVLMELKEVWLPKVKIWLTKFESLLKQSNRGNGSIPVAADDDEVEGAGFAEGNPRVSTINFGYALKMGSHHYLPRRFL